MLNTYVIWRSGPPINRAEIKVSQFHFVAKWQSFRLSDRSI